MAKQMHKNKVSERSFRFRAVPDPWAFLRPQTAFRDGDSPRTAAWRAVMAQMNPPRRLGLRAATAGRKTWAEKLAPKQGSFKDTVCPFETCCFFNTKTKGNHHLQGNAQVYNVRIPAKGPFGLDKGKHFLAVPPPNQANKLWEWLKTNGTTLG